MAQSMNKVFLLGNIGADPELKQFPSGDPYMTVRLATDEAYKDDKDNWQTRPEWHSVTMVGPRAERLADILRKGDRIMVEGRLNTRAVDGDDGKKRYFTDIRARDIVLAGGPRSREDDRPRTTAIAALN